LEIAVKSMIINALHAMLQNSMAQIYYCGFPSKSRIIWKLRILAAVATAGRVRAS
jgi:hypothetical protein